MSTRVAIKGGDKGRDYRAPPRCVLSADVTKQPRIFDSEALKKSPGEKMLNAPCIDDTMERKMSDAVHATDIVVAAEPNDDLPDDQSTVIGTAMGVTTESKPQRSYTTSAFHETFGCGGLAMVFMFLGSAVWTLTLAVIQIDPTGFANRLMNTTTFDRGDFWLLPDPNAEIEVPAVIMLVVISAGYLAMVVLMLFPNKLMPVSRKSKSAKVSEKHDGNKVPKGSGTSEGLKSCAQITALPPWSSWERIKFETTSPLGLVRLYYNPVLDLPKLLFQTSQLLTYLYEGFPLAIIGIYTSLLFANWLLSFYRYKRERPDPHFVLARLFYGFDLFFAVFAPLEVLLYSKYNFKFNRDEYATRLHNLDEGSFERTARLFADPAQVSIFRIAFHYLQFSAASTLLIKGALNALSLFKWTRTIMHLIGHHRASEHPVPSQPAEAIPTADTQRKFRAQKLVTASIFLFAGCGIFAYSIAAIVSTNQVCEPYSQCAVRSFEWNVGAKHCSCLVFVDRVRIGSFDEWEKPTDTSSHLAALAATGHLKIVQIINRAVPEFPTELRRCHHLEQLILLYTKTTRFPDWAREFTRLEYLHVEGDQTAKQLVYLPKDLFADMSHLLFIHLGCLMSLPAVPDLNGLDHLRYLVMALLHSVTEIPRLDDLSHVKLLAVIDAIQVYALPSLTGLTNLETMMLTSRNPVCCNGFITDRCDLSDFQCKDRTSSGEPLVQCTNKRLSSADKSILQGANGVVCQTNLTYDLKDLAPTRDSTDLVCGGVMFKQCSIGGTEGMCFNARMMVISCRVETQLMLMREAQIALGVGEPCDPIVEAWLGCKA